MSAAIPCAAVESDAQPEAGVALRYGDPCDDRNRRLYIENHHAFRSYLVTLRWNAAGGKALTGEIFVEPKVIQEVGCAVEGAQIIKVVATDY